MKILGYSQSSSKPLSLQEIDSLNKEGFNAFCVMGSDLVKPVHPTTNEEWATAFYARYEAIKAIGEKNGNPIKQVKVSVECNADGLEWAKTIIQKFNVCKDVLFYFDEPYNAVEEKRISEKTLQMLLMKLSDFIYLTTSKYLVIGLQARLESKAPMLIFRRAIFAVYSSYFEMKLARPLAFIYGQFCYWHFFNSLRYGALKKKADSLNIDKFYLYQGEKGWFTNLFNNILRRRFIKIFGRK